MNIANPPETIKVLIVDDYEMVRHGLIELLGNFNDLEIVGSLGDGDTAVSFCRTQCPDVILLDMVMPRMGGIAAIKPILESCPNAQILILTSFSEEQNVHAALAAGAVGYLIKNVTGSELAGAIRRAHQGQATLSSEAAMAFVNASKRPPTPGHDLTEREREVLSLMVIGMNNREIGQKLFISSHTVKNHVSSILNKLNTDTRTQAVALAIKTKMLR